MGKGLAVLLAVVAVIAVVMALPLITIWSFNTLFGMGIDYTMWTWLAAFWLHAILSGLVGGAIRRNRN
jgi:hypothetical protein